MKNWLFRMTLCLLSVMLSTISGSAEQSAFPDQTDKLVLHQISGGCADAYLLQAGNTVILIDCGTDAPEKQTVRRAEPLYRYLEHTGIDHVDAHFVTHYHIDHACNTVDLARKYHTQTVYGPSAERPEIFEGLPCPYTQLVLGARLFLGDLEILCTGPDHLMAEGKVNQDSLNFLVRYGACKFLFTGDKMHGKALQSFPELQNIDVLKFPHHGLEPFLISDEALRILKPKIVLVPGYQKGNVRTKLLRMGLKTEVYCLLGGATVLTCDGSEIIVETEIPLPDTLPEAV